MIRLSGGGGQRRYGGLDETDWALARPFGRYFCVNEECTAMAGWKSGDGVVRVLGLGVLGALLLPLMACNNFFQCENKPACPASTGTGTGTGSSSTLDFAFVSYTNSAGNAVITGYNIAGGALTA